MEAHSVIRRTRAPAPTSSVATALSRIVASALVLLVALAACVVWLRRASGALSEPPAPEAMLAAAGFLCLAAVTFRKAHPIAEGPSRRIGAYGLWVVATLVTLLAAAAMTFGGAAGAPLAALWALVALEEALAWGPMIRRRLRSGTASAVSTQGPLATASLKPLAEAHVLDDAPGADAESISQNLVRRRNEEGSESIEGWLRADFVTGQRHATAHVAICPPLARTPQCFAEISDGPSGEVKAAQVLCYGVRFEIKLDKPAEDPTSAIVEFSIQELASEQSEEH